jgi:hypothetical protein
VFVVTELHVLTESGHYQVLRLYKREEDVTHQSTDNNRNTTKRHHGVTVYFNDF